MQSYIQKYIYIIVNKKKYLIKNYKKKNKIIHNLSKTNFNLYPWKFKMVQI